MKVKSVSILMVLLLIGLFSGCSTSANIRLDNSRGVFPVTDSTKIQVHADAKVGGAYDIVGEVIYAHDGNSSSKVINGLCYQASILGADAIVNTRFMTTSVIGSAAELLAYGTAVKLSQ